MLHRDACAPPGDRMPHCKHVGVFGFDYTWMVGCHEDNFGIFGGWKSLCVEVVQHPTHPNLVPKSTAAQILSTNIKNLQRKSCRTTK